MHEATEHPDFAGDEPAVADFCRVCERELAGLAATLEAALPSMAADELRSRGQLLFEGLRARPARQRRAALERAVDGYAERHARTAPGLEAARELTERVRVRLLPALVDAYGAEPLRLAQAIVFMDRLCERFVVAFAQELLDTSERLLAEQRRQTTEALLRFNRLTETGILGVIVCDYLGNIKEANDGFLGMVGYTRAELLSGELRYTDLTPPEWRYMDSDAIEQLRFRGITRPWEKEFLRKDGSRLPVLVGAATLNDSETIAFVLDITERKRLEELRAKSSELENQNRRIQEANRLKSEFLANMSHELRTPLNSIIGFADLLHDGEIPVDSPQHRELLGDILTSGRHLLQLINDILDLAKVEAGKMEFRPEPVELSKITGEVCSVLRTAAASKRIRVHIDVDPEVETVTADPARLKQILYNYLSNALKFTPEGGEVTLRARPEGSRAYRLEVADTGIGIAPSDLGRLFVEFQQLDSSTTRKHAGTGLGLAYTKRLVEAQGGSVGVKSVLGQGSVFFAILPRRARREALDVENSVVPTPRPGASRILVLEDDPTYQGFLAQALGRAGYAVELASTGREAVERCREHRFDAITLDLLLPDMTGLDVLHRLRTDGKNRDTPVIIVSVVAEQGVIAGYRVHDALQKPCEAAELLDSLERAGVHPDKRGVVLVIDADLPSLRAMGMVLRQHGYTAECLQDGASALAVAERERPLAVIVDSSLPDMDGQEFLSRLRRCAGCERVPVIVWTTQDLPREKQDAFAGLAQAVITKGSRRPVSVIEELGALLPKAPVLEEP